jgi:hypothetical protein
MDAKVLSRIRRFAPGVVFSSRRLGGRVFEDALDRLCKAGHIRRLTPGIWHKPATHALLGEVPPASSAIAAAVAELDRTAVQPAGASAANVLGLSDQVPVRAVFLTGGPSRVIRLGKRSVVFKHAAPKYMVGAGNVAGLIITALRYISPAYVDDVMLEAVRRAVPVSERRKVAQVLQAGPAWIAKKVTPVLTR